MKKNVTDISPFSNPTKSAKIIIMEQSRLIIVANRSKFTIRKSRGKLVYTKSPGGLASALSSLTDKYETLWIGWPGIAREELNEDDIIEIAHKLNAEKCFPVFLARKSLKNFYDGFSNKVIWPLFHYFPQYIEFNESYWEEYVKVNRKYAETLSRVYRKGDFLWIHDYHLMLLPAMIREKFPDATIGFFLHIPFPAYEVFRIIPWKREILEGLIGSDLIGFHTYEYGNYFLNSVLKVLGYENDLSYILNGRPVKVDAFPISIDYQFWIGMSRDEDVLKGVDELKKNTGNRKIILSVDRLDYTKGIINRLKAFELFLKKHPEFHGKIIYILIVVPSREDVEYYAEIKREVSELVGEINGNFSSSGWIPLHFYYKSFSQKNLSVFYLAADVALVTPLRDGMNLVAKEYVTVKQDNPGVLILSEMAGAAREMNEAVIINPYDIREISNAFFEALTMDEDEQVKRNRFMQERIRRYDIRKWTQDFVDKLIQVKGEIEERKGKKLTPALTERIKKEFSSARSKLLILDYDGTLIPLQKRPEYAVPDSEILEILEKLTEIENADVVVISGRDRKFLEKWFDQINFLHLVAEHGVWVRERDGEWYTIEPVDSSWKDEIRNILERFMLSTPGSFIEEKEYSLAWHFREADPEQVVQKRAELKSALVPVIANKDLSVLEGDKVLEIKNAGINKGAAVKRWLERKEWEFILAAGDDKTDEDVFNILPENAYSVKVGIKPSKAKFYVENPVMVRYLLQAFLT